MKKIIVASLTFIFLWTGSFSPAYAQNPPTIESYKMSYQTLRSHLRWNKDIQLFGGGLVLSEFNDDTENVYAGHIGGFWTPPFYSSPNGGGVKTENEWRRGFNLGVVFYNYTSGTGFAEETSNPATEASWYPSKMVLNKSYSGSGRGTDVRGVKVALPGVRGFGLKLTITNTSSSPQSLGMLMLGSLPTFDAVRGKDGSHTWGWNWMMTRSTRRETNGYYDSTEKAIVIEDPSNSAYMAAGLSENPDSWGLDENYENNNYNFPLYDQFRNKNGGHLQSTDGDNNGNGTTFGLVSQAPALSQNQSRTVTLVVGVGATKDEALNVVRTYRTKDIETEADNFWNQRLSSLFSNLPTFSSGDETINKIYRNAALTYLDNRWITLNFVGELAGYSQSSSFYPWMLGTAGFFPLADGPFWREQLRKVLSMDLANCRAYDPVSGDHLCDHGYTYNNTSVINAVYRYVTTTSDFGFLDESTLQRLNNLAIADDQKEYGSNHLADFGSDNNLYEYNIQCPTMSLRGQYTGLVVSPNGERVVAHQEIADLAEKKGNQTMATQNRNKANQIKAGLQTLWNPSKGWFDTISLYDENTKNRTSPLRVTFWGMFPLLLLQYDNLLTNEQIQSLINNISKFRGTYGFTSLSNDLKPWCTTADYRTDWHGPGLYSGAAGAVLTGLFKNGKADIAYDLLSPADGTGYAYLAQMPYFSQAFPSTQQIVGQLPAYLEGVSLAQSIIEGMFGVYPNVNQTKIAPRIPARLLSKGSVSLRNLKTQTHVWNITVNSQNNQTLDMAVGGASNGSNADHFRFEYDMAGTLNLMVSRLAPNKYFTIKATPVAGGNPVIVEGKTNGSGVLQGSMPINGHNLITGSFSSVSSPTPTPTPITKPGDLNGDGKVDIYDYNILVSDFGKTGSPGWIKSDITKDGKVDIYDYNQLVANFGK